MAHLYVLRLHFSGHLRHLMHFEPPGLGWAEQLNDIDWNCKDAEGKVGFVCFACRNSYGPPLVCDVLQTALMMAAECDLLQAVKRLLSRGAKPDEVDNAGRV